jgi:hypothetical protein
MRPIEVVGWSRLGCGSDAWGRAFQGGRSSTLNRIGELGQNVASQARPDGVEFGGFHGMPAEP